MRVPLVLLLGAACLTCGCEPAPAPQGSSPTPALATPSSSRLQWGKLARDIVQGKACASPRSLRQSYVKHAEELFLHQQFEELEQFLDALDRQDALQTLCPPALVLDQILKAQEKQFEQRPYKLWISVRWLLARKTSRWARAGLEAALLARSDMRKKFCDFQEDAPLWEDAVALDRSAADIARGRRKDASLPVFHEFMERRAGRFEPGVLLQMIPQYPRDVFLYARLATFYKWQSPDVRKNWIRSLQGQPDQYALFFTMIAPTLPVADMKTDEWDWSALEQGFGRLLKESPQAIEIRNASAVAAQVSGRVQVAVEIMKLPGYQWDTVRWGDARNFERRLPGAQAFKDSPCELHLPAPLVAEEPGSVVDCLLRKRQWPLLTEYLRELPTGTVRGAAYEEFSNPGKEEPEAAYVARERLLNEWYSETPSAESALALGILYENYAWLARGHGFADTVSEEGWRLFRERLQKAEKLLDEAERLGDSSLELYSEQMTLCYSLSGDRQRAQEIALKATRFGVEGMRVVEQWAEFLLPRWHGKPGDLDAAAVTLRQTVGHDAYYAAMALMTLRSEGGDTLRAGHPFHVDWNRLLGSLQEGQRKGVLSQPLLQRTLAICEENQDRGSARKLLPLAARNAVNKVWDSQENYEACLRWARGSGPWRLRPVHYSWKRVGKAREKLRKEFVFGFRGTLNPSPVGDPPFGLVALECPPVTAPSGFSYTEAVGFNEWFGQPADQLHCLWVFTKDWEMIPGTYTATYYDEEGRALHRESFEFVR